MGKTTREAKVRLHIKGMWYANIGPVKKGRATPIYFPRATVKTESQAWRYLDVQLKAQAAGRISAISPTVYGLCQLYLSWLEERVSRELFDQAEFSRVSTKLTLLWDSTIGDASQPIRDIKASAFGAELLESAIEGWQSQGYKPSYLAGVVRSTKRVFAWASQRVAGRSPTIILEVNPIKDVKLPTIPQSPERFAERQEIAAFLRFFRHYADGAGRGYKGVVKKRSHGGRKSLECRFDRLTILAERMMIHSGARPGEICNTCWSDVKWDAGRTPSGHRYAKIVLPPDRWKAGKKTGRNRTIYLSPILTRAIRREFERVDRHPVHIFAHRCGPRDRLEGSERETGAPWNSGALSAKVRKIRRLAIAAGVDLQDEGPNALVNYLFRHTAISTMVMMGIDIATIAEMTGTSADMIRKTYQHLLDSHLARAADVFHTGKRKV